MRTIQHNAFTCPGYPCSDDCDHVEFLPDPDLIVHDEKRMHLAELAPHCVRCLQARLKAIMDLAPEIIDALENAEIDKDNEWWRCNEGTFVHEQIREEQAKISRVLEKARELLSPET